jgi:hypothetical protein
MLLLVSVSESRGMLWHLVHDLIYIKINKMTAFFPTSLVHIAGSQADETRQSDLPNRTIRFA